MTVKETALSLLCRNAWLNLLGHLICAHILVTILRPKGTELYPPPRATHNRKVYLHGLRNFRRGYGSRGCTHPRTPRLVFRYYSQDNSVTSKP